MVLLKSNNRLIKANGILLRSKKSPVSLIKYGKLYSWDELDNKDVFGADKLITGFHIPSDAEWTTLTDYIDTEHNQSPDDFGVGNHLKHRRKNGTPVVEGFNTSTHPRWDAEATHYGRDTVGFGALPAGGRHSSGSFYSLGSSNSWWSATESSSTTAWYRYMPSSNGEVSRYNSDKTYSFSVRCLRAATTPELDLADGTNCGQVTDYDGNIYDTVKIGTQVWTIQNLATTKDLDGNSITCFDYGNDDTNTFFANAGESIW